MAIVLGEILGLGDSTCLASQDWPHPDYQNLRCIVLGTTSHEQVANIVVDTKTQQVFVLELVEPDCSAVWIDPQFRWTTTGPTLTSTQALQILANMLQQQGT